MIDNDALLLVYRKLILARRCEERIRSEYFGDEMKTPVHLGVGQEAIPVGVCHVLPKETRYFATYRNHALYLAVTEDTDSFFGELYGKATGGAKGKAGSMHLSAPEQGLMVTSAVVGTTIPVAVGAAFANAYRESNDIVAVFFGDGAAEEGVFWESLNFACLHRLRILFVCEDNGLAIHTPIEQRRGFRSLSEAVNAFDCHQASGDGSDVTNVIDGTARTLEAMRVDPKPAFLHLTYFRFLEHVGVREDFDAGYRERPGSNETARLDPVALISDELLRRGVQGATLASIRGDIEGKIDLSVRAAQQAPFPTPAELYTDVFA